MDREKAEDAEDELMAAYQAGYQAGRKDAALAIEVDVGIAYLAGLISRALAKRIIEAALGERSEGPVQRRDSEPEG